ncbi:DctP family TRAP transporter solute-binding subunit [Halalkalibacter urbisdiaboli]|uniref:DctP family TRAP transporter solute-binding subunit n=1 Tax=Halalkalibacter urbisdiaboli TaxID=1960589 RepID=UPI001FD8D1C1|nr:DctP family TRAP transporter solute-binding subunit [Halalkalibacter urbisdiaboli]
MNGQTSRRYLRMTIILVLTVFILLTGCGAKSYPEDHEQLSEDERIIIRFSHIVGEQTPKGLAARRFAKLIKERSNGYIEVQVFPNGYLYKDGEELEALKKGDIQMIAPATSKITNIVPEWQILDLPFAFHNVEEVHDYLEGKIGNRLMTKLEAKGFYPVSTWDNGFKQMTNSSHPLREIEDFSGLQLRVMPSPVLKAQFSELNTRTQSNSFNEVFHLLENKEIVGQENTFSNIYSKNLQLLQNYLTVSNHGYLGYVVLMNKTFWDGLPEDVQSLLQETMDEVAVWERMIAQELNSLNFRELEKCNCIDIHHLTADEKRLWEEAFEPVYQQVEYKFGTEYIRQLPKNKR